MHTKKTEKDKDFSQSAMARKQRDYSQLRSHSDLSLILYFLLGRLVM